MRKLLATTAVLVALIAPAHANFTIYGVMNKLMTGIEIPTCSQYTKWVKANPDEREVLKEWLLGFRSGLESQMAYEPEYDKRQQGQSNLLMSSFPCSTASAVNFQKHRYCMLCN